ncbi:hypothetical protein T03_3486 [Trichinella britovi]|uniref:Uncharacterized protein n=1 Tax=Trichinella britovi TaxID=45882 RepID=A0A0V1D8K1_TRIBR|nr:hypothetical protein T03_3486 [Trichinella britovi]
MKKQLLIQRNNQMLSEITFLPDHNRDILYTNDVIIKLAFTGDRRKVFYLDQKDASSAQNYVNEVTT